MFACFAFSFDHATPMKLCIVDEAQIILVHVVLEAEEKHGEDGDIGHEDREEHSNCKCGQAVRHMVTKIKCISIDERFLVFSANLLRCMDSLHDSTNDNVWDV